MKLNQEIRNLLNFFNDFVFIVDVGTGEIVFANETAHDYLGFNSKIDELTNLTVQDIHPLEMPQLLEFYERVKEKGSGVTDSLHCMSKAGHMISGEISARWVEFEDRELILLTVRPNEGKEEVEVEETANPALNLSFKFPREFENPDFNREMASLARFTAENPFPVIRLSLKGEVLYGNKASVPFLKEWGKNHKGSLPPELMKANRDAADIGSLVITEVETRGLYMQFIFSRPFGADYVNVYGQDVTKLRNTERALTAAKEQAEKANRAKSDFIASMSEELRAPLNTILDYNQLMYMEPDETPIGNHKTSLNIALSEGYFLQELIKGVLDLSALEKGHLSLDMNRVDIGLLFREVMVMVEPLVRKKGIRISQKLFVEKGLLVWADPFMLKQVLLNLFSNAIKYNQEGGKVIAGAKAAGASRVRIYIKDTGMGIPEDKMDELFEPFNRLGAEKRGVDGFGLGLPIVNTLIQKMGSMLSIKSKIQEGSEFSFELNSVKVVTRNTGERVH